jgi:hypothetical protein
MTSISSMLITPWAPQPGMPPGRPPNMIAWRYGVPFSASRVGYRSGPVAPPRSAPWQPAQRSK